MSRRDFTDERPGAPDENSSDRWDRLYAASHGSVIGIRFADGMWFVRFDSLGVGHSNRIAARAKLFSPLEEAKIVSILNRLRVMGRTATAVVLRVAGGRR